MRLCLVPPLGALAGALAVLTPVPAQAAGLTARVDRPETSVDEPIELTLTVEGSSTSTPQLPDLSAFEVESRGQSSQVQIINGRMSSSVIHTYLLQPKRAGTFTIGPASVEIGGRTYQSQPIAVRVTGAGQSSGQTARQAFVTATISNEQPYVGEQIVYTFRFFRQVRVAGARAQLPEFEGLVSESLGEQTEGTMEYEGQSYVVTEIKKALFTQEAGTRTIAAASLVAQLELPGQRRRRASPFDDFGDPFGDLGGFFGQGRIVTRTLRSPAIALHVRPLPPAPAGFSGLVGAFDIRTALSKRSLKVGDSATLEIIISGRGNIRGIPEPPLPALPAFKLYDDKPEMEVTADHESVHGRKVFRKALVPREPGDATLPAFRLVHFDPSRSEFVTASSQPIDVHVLPGEGEQLHVAARTSAPVAAKQAVEVVGDDILPIHTRARLWTREDGRLWSRVAAAGLAMPPLAFLSGLLIVRRRERLRLDGRRIRRRGAMRRARAALSDAQRLIEQGRTTDALHAAEQAFKSFVGDLLDVPGLALTAADIEARLIAAGVGADLVRRVRGEADALEAAAYGGSAAAAVSPSTLIERFEPLWRELERAA